MDGVTETRLTWRRDKSTPARMYVSTDGRYTIIYDPAGPVEGERGGWYVHREHVPIGLRYTLKDAKALAEASDA